MKSIILERIRAKREELTKRAAQPAAAGKPKTQPAAGSTTIGRYLLQRDGQKAQPKTQPEQQPVESRRFGFSFFSARGQKAQPKTQPEQRPDERRLGVTLFPAGTKSKPKQAEIAPAEKPQQPVLALPLPAQKPKPRRKITPRKTGAALVKACYEKRGEWAHKGEYGRVLIVAGCAALTGSPCFAGMAAYRAGADLVFVAAPERAANVAANFSPSLMTLQLGGTHLALRHVDKVAGFAQVVRAKSLLIGPGLWRDEETISAVRAIIEKTSTPMVIDADAIRAVAGAKHVLAGKIAVLTPHAGEFKELTGVTLSNDVAKRAQEAEQAARDLGAVILLKGHVDVITDGRTTLLNKTGSPFMTKGGCGDTLAGICAALLGRGVAPLQAAAAAAHLNGRAGELASRELGEGLLPTDLIEKIPDILEACGA